MKKVLIISNGCFSNTDSNGRTLAKLFKGYNRDDLSQFYVYGLPDFNVCSNYYHMSDKMAMKSVFKPLNGEIKKNLEKSIMLSSPSTKKTQKTPFKKNIREVVWSLGLRNNKYLKRWIDSIAPEVIFLFLADNSFLVELAIEISKKKNIPIIVYSTENYSFKKHNYITNKKSLNYVLFHNSLKRVYKKLEKYVVKGIFNTPFLAELYQNEYSYPCECIFSKSDIEYIENSTVNENIEISYLGNFGVGRHNSLVDIANALFSINPQYKLNLYGTIPNDEVKKAFEKCNNISYKGFVSYEEVVKIMHSSTLLIHTEPDNAYYNMDLKYAFSTKISDSICCGTPLLMYANAKLAETSFLLNEKCAFVVCEKSKLIDTLRESLENEIKRKEVLQNAYQVRNKYFIDNSYLINIIQNI